MRDVEGSSSESGCEACESCAVNEKEASTEITSLREEITMTSQQSKGAVVNFKVGDRVRIVDDSNGIAGKGTIITVRAADVPYPGWLDVHWDRGTWGICPPEHLEPVSE